MYALVRTWEHMDRMAWPILKQGQSFTVVPIASVNFGHLDL